MTTLDCLQAVGAVAALGASWMSLGFRILRPARAGLCPAETLALSLLAGAGVEAVVLFLVGQVWFSAPVVVICALAGLSPLLSPAERAALGETVRALETPRPSVCLLLALPLLVFLLAALARPVGAIWEDGVAYHLLGPVVWLRHGRIEPVLDMAHTAFPSVIEVLFAAGMSLANERTPGVIGLLLASAVMVQAAGLTRWLGAAPGWAGATALLVAVMPAVSDKVTRAYIDVEYAGFALGAVRLMLTGSASGGPFRAGALFLGLAMGTKYNGLTMVPITLTLALLHGVRQSGVKQAVRVTAGGMALAVAVALPFYLRNYLVLGVPLYPPFPWLAGLGRPKAFPAGASVDLQRIVDLRGEGFGRSALDFILLPLRFTYHPHRFHGAGGIGVVPLAFLPAGLLRWERPEIRYSAAWLALNTLAWFVAQQEARFLAPVAILATAIAVMGASHLVARGSRLARLAWLLALTTSVAYCGAVLSWSYLAPAASVVDARRDQVWWQEKVPYADAFAFLNGLPEPSRILMLSYRPPPYYLHRDYLKVVGYYGERPIDDVYDLATALARRDRLAFTHVLDVVDAAGDFRIDDPIPAELELVFQSPTARVYRVQR